MNTWDEQNQAGMLSGEENEETPFQNEDTWVVWISLLSMCFLELETDTRQIQV